MTGKKMRPGALAGAHRTSESQSLSTSHPEFMTSPRMAQAHFLRRRFRVAPQRAAMVAPLAFWEARL